MKKITLLVLFLISGLSHAQEFDFEKIQTLTSKDTLWIDIQRKECFGGTWSKYRITKKNKDYNFVRIDHIGQLLVREKKILDSLDEMDTWLKENFAQLALPKNKYSLTEKEYILFIKNIQLGLEQNKNCKSSIAGKSTFVEIQLAEEKSQIVRKCHIYFGQ